MQGREPLTGKLKVTIDLYKNCKIDSQSFGDVDNHQKAIFDILIDICYTYQQLDCLKPYILEYVDEITALNPNLPNYLQVGDKIKIRHLERE